MLLVSTLTITILFARLLLLLRLVVTISKMEAGFIGPSDLTISLLTSQFQDKIDISTQKMYTSKAQSVLHIIQERLSALTACQREVCRVRF